MDNKSELDSLLTLDGAQTSGDAGATAKSKWPALQRDFNKNILDAHLTLKYGQWSYRQLILRRKAFLVLILLVLFGFYMSTIMQEHQQNDLDAALYVPVLHHSHVLGMKDMYTEYNNRSINNITINAANENRLPPKGYLVWSDYCKIPNIDPYTRDVMKHFKRFKYKKCSNKPALTQVAYNETSERYMLSVLPDALNAYIKGDKIISCCYHAIERITEMQINLSDCKRFATYIELAPSIDNVLVKCYNNDDNNKQFYINGHAMIAERAALRAHLNKWRQRDKKHNNNKPVPSVLMFGIDSVSRVNLIRAMPKTAQYLYNNEWFELTGYNKIADNTFPNLMAVLTGYNKSSALQKCNPRVLGGLDNCTFMWNHYQQHGYVTAFAEDAASINTFNFLKKGFQQPPVDYYLRPYLMAAEAHLKVSTKSGLVTCVGLKHESDYVYDYALEFVRRYRNDTYFGLFWTNTFSHQDLSDCSAMDEHIVEYLRALGNLGVYNKSIVIFFSDHGMRFGLTRKTASGHLEERLPFMFIWLPAYLKQKHPEYANALSMNKNRLTNPFDLHMTLKHILLLSGRLDANKQQQMMTAVPDCIRCHSLLQPVLHNRSCTDIGIEDHWCTCIPYESIYQNSKHVRKLAYRVVNYLNDYVAHFHNGSFASRCMPLQLQSVYSAFRAPYNKQNNNNNNNNTNIKGYRLVFYTRPNKGLYEATLRYNEHTDAMHVTGEVSRLNAYNGEADCMDDFGAKKYCVCKNWKHKL